MSSSFQNPFRNTVRNISFGKGALGELIYRRSELLIAFIVYAPFRYLSYHISVHKCSVLALFA